MSHVKSDYQSQVSEEVLDNQMQICMDDPEIENFSSAPSLKIIIKTLTKHFALMRKDQKIPMMMQ